MKTLSLFAAALLAISASAQTPVPQCMPVNKPCGTPQGIKPGLVAWAHVPGAVTAEENDSLWFADSKISQEACDIMMNADVMAVAGTTDVAAAWHSILADKLGRHYIPGRKIAVKINTNNTYSHDDSPEINAAPQMILALLRSLVNRGGVDQADIIIAEPSRFITRATFEKCHAEFPQVTFLDNAGGDGRQKAEFVADEMEYSCDNGQLARGIERAFVDADFVINMALLKGHVGQGVTLCAKNWYGAMSLHADWRKNYHNNFDQDRQGRPRYLTFVDYMSHPALGGKCVLYLVDGLLGSKTVAGLPAPKWQSKPFNGDWPCSLLASQDPVAIDCVALDLLSTEFPDGADMAYSDAYLQEASMIGNPPSGTAYRYAPEQGSMGVAEHRDTATGTYSGTGINLLYIPLK